MIQFHLAIVPPKATSQSAGKRMVIPKDRNGRVVGRPMFFKNTKSQGAENDLTMLCSQHAPEAPIEGPVRLHVDYVWPWRKTEPKKRVALGRVPHTSKPDSSNAVKMLEDVLTKLRFWNDDGQVSELIVSKAWGDRVGITVTITPLGATTPPLPAAHQPLLF